MKFGLNEYDAQMANAQLRAFKLTKAILRKARRNSASDVHKKIEDMGFKVDDTRPKNFVPPLAGPPPTCPLPTPPTVRKRSKSSREDIALPAPLQQKSKPASAPGSPSRPPAVPKKASNRLSQLPPPPPPVTIPRRRSSIELPQQKSTSPLRSSRAGSPIPSVISARMDSPPPPPPPPPKSPVPPEKDVLPVLPFRRKPVPKSTAPVTSYTVEPIRRPSTPRLPPIPTQEPPVPPRSPYRSSIYGNATPPLIPKRRSLQRSISFRFGEGLQGSISRSLYSELSNALDDLQRSLGGATVEVH